MLLGLAARNVLRNRRRSAITVSSIAIGLAAMTFMWGFIDGMNRQMVENTTRYYSADAQVHLKGYHDDPTLDLTIPDATAVISASRNGYPSSPTSRCGRRRPVRGGSGRRAPSAQPPDAAGSSMPSRNSTAVPAWIGSLL